MSMTDDSGSHFSQRYFAIRDTKGELLHAELDLSHLAGNPSLGDHEVDWSLFAPLSFAAVGDVCEPVVHESDEGVAWSTQVQALRVSSDDGDVAVIRRGTEAIVGYGRRFSVQVGQALVLDAESYGSRLIAGAEEARYVVVVERVADR